MTEERRSEVAAALTRVEERLEAACTTVGRTRAEVTLVVVTKFFPASDVRLLHALGVRDVGENRYQEALGKREDCADLDLRWHFLGQLQSNKATAVGRWADVVQSLDRGKLVAPLARGGLPSALDVLVQVNLDAAPGPAGGRGGAAPSEVVALAEKVAGTEGLRLRGVMAVAPRDEPPRPAFERLRSVADDVRGVVPDATWISAGMSGDLEVAVECGATHVRVGGAILGNRPVNG